MKTWYVIHDNHVYLITAENVEMAKIWLLKYHKIAVESKDLQLVKTSTRWTRKII